MEARIIFTANIYVSGDTLEDIKKKWEEMPIFCVDALDSGADISGVCIVEDAVTCKDITDEWYKEYNT